MHSSVSNLSPEAQTTFGKSFNNCLFSINALNKLIEKESGSNNKDYQVDWNQYKDKLIILTNGTLSIENINKIDDKCVFLK